MLEKHDCTTKYLPPWAQGSLDLHPLLLLPFPPPSTIIVRHHQRQQQQMHNKNEKDIPHFRTGRQFRGTTTHTHTYTMHPPLPDGRSARVHTHIPQEGYVTVSAVCGSAWKFCGMCIVCRAGTTIPVEKRHADHISLSPHLCYRGLSPSCACSFCVCFCVRLCCALARGTLLPVVPCCSQMSSSTSHTHSLTHAHTHIHIHTHAHTHLHHMHTCAYV